MTTYDHYPQRVMMNEIKPPDSLDFQGSYMSPVHDEDHLYEMACRFLAGVEFDTLVGTGLSGTIAVIKLAKMLDKRYLLVRKPNDGSHSSQPAEGSLGRRWVFVDDLISSGRTFARVWNKIQSWGFDTEFVGVFLYGTDGGFDPAKWVAPMDLSAGWMSAEFEKVVMQIQGRDKEVERIDMLEDWLVKPVAPQKNPILPIPMPADKADPYADLYYPAGQRPPILEPSFTFTDRLKELLTR
ncbi:phosphoribosyl transferase [Mycobacterium phage NearlyHeadless]|nr:phosphoribosyl transferase [Mycobacterium phage NearlyHeadless]